MEQATETKTSTTEGWKWEGGELAPYTIRHPDRNGDWTAEKEAGGFRQLLNFGNPDWEDLAVSVDSTGGTGPGAVYLIEITLGDQVEVIGCDGLANLLDFLRYIEPVKRMQERSFDRAFLENHIGHHNTHEGYEPSCRHCREPRTLAVEIGRGVNLGDGS
jgi:hypothetical protein